MKFPRNAHVTKGSLEAAPWAAVMFLIVIFIMLGGLLYTPGVHVRLPVTDELPGTDKFPIRVALDASGQLFFENQHISESSLTNRLRELVLASPEKPALVVQADKGATYENLIRLMQLARAAGIETTVLATAPRPFSKAANPVP
jgi:biopolymer transport protein ExbD